MLLQRPQCQSVSPSFQEDSFPFTTVTVTHVTADDTPVQPATDTCVGGAVADLAAFFFIVGMSSLALFLQISISLKLLALLLSSVIFGVFSQSSASVVIVCFHSLCLFFFFHQVVCYFQQLHIS